jgi:hypothetical protein
MLAGFAKTTVNPPLGMPMEGLGQQGGIEKILDDLFIRGLYLSHEDEDVLILACDLLFFTRAQVNRIKGAVGRVADLTPRQILLNCSHTHAGPRVTPWAFTGDIDPLYFDQIIAAMESVAVAAKADRRPVTIDAGMTRTDVPRSRRKIDAEGKAEWAPSEKAPICDALPVVRFTDDAGAVVCLLFSVSCHPSTWYELAVTADYPGVAVRRLNARYGTENAMFLQGTGGDTKAYTIAVSEDYWRHGKWEDVEQAGNEVADAVIARIDAGLTPITPNLKACVVPTCWPFEAPPSREEIEAACDAQTPGSPRHTWAVGLLTQLDRGLPLMTGLEIDMHGVKIGDGLRLVGLEGEAVAELGLLMLEEYPTGVTFPMGYTDATRIYLTVSHMRAEQGYEVDSYWEYGYPAALAVGTEEIMHAGIAELKRCGID